MKLTKTQNDLYQSLLRDGNLTISAMTCPGLYRAFAALVNKGCAEMVADNGRGFVTFAAIAR